MQKIGIKLRSYCVPLIEDSCKQIMDAARTTDAKTTGTVPVPTKKRIYCVLKSPHVHRDARFHHTSSLSTLILYPTAQTIDSLVQLDLPAGGGCESQALKKPQCLTLARFCMSPLILFPCFLIVGKKKETGFYNFCS
ncbi:hypothetical protein GQ457_13G001550 [Hibiscus cannabinus]